MTLHATEHLRNVRATLLNYIAGLTLAGSPTLQPAEASRTAAAQASPYMRARVNVEGGDFDGRYDATTLAYWTSAVVTIDLFWRSGEQAGSYSSADIDDAASQLAHAFRRAHIQLNDYVTDPANPTAVPNISIAFRRPVVPRQLPTSGLWLRRQVIAEGRFHLLHSTT